MELVTVIRAHLKRVGSTHGGIFGGNHKEFTVVREVPNEEPESILSVLIEIAEEKGEPSGSLSRLTVESTWGRNGPTLKFDIQQSNIQYGEPYAECQVFAALKVGTRYFKLEELK